MVPIIELSILVWIGGQTEWWVPVLVVIGTGVVGAVLARRQGWQVLQRIRADSVAGRVPAEALIDGFLILLAGILLVTPGVLSDLVGVVLLIPPLRAGIKRAVAVWLRRSIEVRINGAPSGSRPSTGGRPFSRRDEIIDAHVIGTHVEDAE